MKNIVTEQARFKVIHTTFKDSTGMKKGFTRTRDLFKVLDNGVLTQEFTRDSAEAWICICVGGVTASGGVGISLDCKKSEKAIKNTSMWSNRKNEEYTSILIKVN